jgi:hypothetical protein
MAKAGKGVKANIGEVLGMRVAPDACQYFNHDDNLNRSRKQ